MKALILAGGFGVRLREVLHGHPKHLISINGKPFLRRLIELLSQKGITDCVLSVGYLAQEIIDEFSQGVAGIKINFSQLERPLGTGGALKKAQKFFPNDFLVINGDTYLDIDYHALLKAHQANRALVTLVGTRRNPRQSGGSIIFSGQKVTKFIPNSQARNKKHQLLHAGVYAISPQLFKYLQPEKSSLDKEIIPQLIKIGKKICCYPVNQEFIDIDSPQQLKRAIEILK